MQTSIPFATAASPQAQTIHRSWARCAGLDRHLLADPNPLSRADLNHQREAHRPLLDHAQASLHALGALAHSSHGIAILAGPSGLILHEHGNPSFLDKAQRVALSPGVSWAETARGTNAIGTALHDKHAVRIHGPDHFLKRNRILSCHAAPIFSPAGGILGILDLSGPANTLHDHALPLVQGLARGISQQILLAQSGQRLIFRAANQPAGAFHQAMLLLDESGLIIGANEVALQVLDTDWRLIGTPYEQWISGTPSPQDRRLHRHDGRPLIAALQTPARPAMVPGQALTRLPPRPAAARPDALPAPDATTQPLLDQAIRATHAGLAVLLHGETGTGKEVLARHIHARGARAGGTFVAINCAALPEHLIESELFGYEPGAFTGARREGARGLLRQAHLGTLFLDEIGDMPLGLQTRLLRVLQEREVQPLGSEKRYPLDFSLISASHQDLPDLIAKGLFRSDLYYRLQDMPLELPALRQRADLAEFIQHAYHKLGGQIGSSAVAILAKHRWPGNYRELDSLLRRLRCQFPDHTLIGPEHLPDALRTHGPQQPASLPGTPAAAPDPIGLGSTTDGSLTNLQQAAIQQALQSCAGNMTQAAKILGIHRSTLYRKLRKQ